MIRLEYFQREDFGQLAEWGGDEAFLVQWAGNAGFQHPLTVEQLEVYAEGANTPESDKFLYKVIDEESGRSVGHISIRLDKLNNSGRIGRVLIGDPTARGKGIGLAMILEMLKIGFEDLGLHRVTLGVFDFNQSAIACYKKAGFVQEGVMRKSTKVGDHYWTLIEMGILKEEYFNRL